MFDPAIYRDRRNRLKKDVGSGLILLLGNDEVGMNYAANTYHFRQDSTFLYFFAVDLPGLAALIDVDRNTETLFGDDLTVADIVWTGPQPTIADQAKAGAVGATAPMAELGQRVADAVAQGRRVHFLKPYRAEHTLKLTALIGLKPTIVASYRSEPLHKAVVAQRNVKSAAEVEEIEQAIGVSRQMYLTAMAAARPGKHEYEVVAEIMRVAKANGCDLSFPIICSVHGETLHNHNHANLMQQGDVMVLDSGVETPTKYASDITRTIPVGGTFTPQQRQIYEMVLRAQLAAIKAIKPGVQYRDVHLLAARSFTLGAVRLTDRFFPGGEPWEADSMRLAQTIADGSGYPYPPLDTGCVYTGTLADYAVSEGAPAVDMELTNHRDTDFEINVVVLDVFLNWIR